MVKETASAGELALMVNRLARQLEGCVKSLDAVRTLAGTGLSSQVFKEALLGAVKVVDGVIQERAKDLLPEGDS